MFGSQAEVSRWIGVLLFCNRTYIQHCAGPYPGIQLFQYQFNYHINLAQKNAMTFCSFNLYFKACFVFSPHIYVPRSKPYDGSKSKNGVISVCRFMNLMRLGQTIQYTLPSPDSALTHSVQFYSKFVVLQIEKQKWNICISETQQLLRVIWKDPSCRHSSPVQS